ncbi:hypothetical protein EVAR_36275_1 [Eumeta japonica]|uniref:Uncharacterized protein n=1 Tax=Eumeta variegata TaxID=151549 RepID=A0A4C1VI37_EUMVA|nr:hypothetical protein EVAR_36275_1 [Eumeta japonica]
MGSRTLVLSLMAAKLESVLRTPPLVIPYRKQHREVIKKIVPDATARSAEARASYRRQPARRHTQPRSKAAAARSDKSITAAELNNPLAKEGRVKNAEGRGPRAPAAPPSGTAIRLPRRDKAEEKCRAIFIRSAAINGYYRAGP